MNPSFLWQIGWSLLLPMLVVLAILILGRAVYHKNIYLAGIFTSFAVALGFLAGHWVLFGRPVWPPSVSPHGVIRLVLASVIVGAFKQKITVQSGPRWGLRVGWMLCSILVQMQALELSTWKAGILLVTVAGLVGGSLLFWLCLSQLNHEADSLASVSMWLVLTVFISVIVFLSGSADLGHSAAVLAACFFVLWIALLFGWQSIELSAILCTAVTGITGLVQEAYLYSDVKEFPILCLFAAPGAGLIAHRWTAGKSHSFRIAAVSLATALVGGLALAWSVLHMSSASY